MGEYLARGQNIFILKSVFWIIPISVLICIVEFHKSCILYQPWYSRCTPYMPQHHFYCFSLHFDFIGVFMGVVEAFFNDIAGHIFELLVQI